jgi:hypothetical protein
VPTPSLMTRQRPLPTRLDTADLLRTTADVAEQIKHGAWTHLLPPGGAWPTDDRWCRQLFADDELDVWAISWVPDRTTELHDHGGSLGALTVVDGALAEWRWTGSRLRERRLGAGAQAAFPLGWVHDVTWAEPGVSPLVTGGTTPGFCAPALSVHAYSPPLTVMSYYEVTEHQALRRVRAELTDIPERPKR